MSGNRLPSSAAHGVDTELGLGRRVVDMMDAALKRVLRTELVKWAEWRHVQRVTQRGSAPKQAPIAVESSPTLANGSPILPASSPTVVQAAPTPARQGPTLVPASPTGSVPSPTEVVGPPIAREKAA